MTWPSWRQYIAQRVQKRAGIQPFPFVFGVNFSRLMFNISQILTPCEKLIEY